MTAKAPRGLQAKLAERIPEWTNPPKWIGKVQPCRTCDRPIRVLRQSPSATAEARWAVVNAEPDASGWIRVWLNDHRVTYSRDRLGVVPGQPYLSFRSHRCPNRPGPSSEEISETSPGPLDKPGRIG